MKKELQAANSKKLSMFQEVYPICEPHAYAAVVREPATQKMRYEVIEPTLREREKNQLREIKDLLVEEINVSLKDLETKEKAKEYLENKVREIVQDYRMKVAEEAMDKLLYYIVRDFIGYGKIDPLMKDHMIEDISADGVNIPIYVWHREYESLPTNIIFKEADELNSFTIRLAYLARKHISVARPMLDAALSPTEAKLPEGVQRSRFVVFVSIRLPSQI